MQDEDIALSANALFSVWPEVQAMRLPKKVNCLTRNELPLTVLWVESSPAGLRPENPLLLGTYHCRNTFIARRLRRPDEHAAIALDIEPDGSTS